MSKTLQEDCKHNIYVHEAYASEPRLRNIKHSIKNYERKIIIEFFYFSLILSHLQESVSGSMFIETFFFKIVQGITF